MTNIPESAIPLLGYVRFSYKIVAHANRPLVFSARYNGNFLLLDWIRAAIVRSYLSPALNERFGESNFLGAGDMGSVSCLPSSRITFAW